MYHALNLKGRPSKGGFVRITAPIALGLLGILMTSLVWRDQQATAQTKGGTASMKILPKPTSSGKISLEEAINRRRSVRNFQDLHLTAEELSQILWAAQGKTGPGGLRTTPSAGARYPLDIYIVIGKVGGFDSGVYHYNPQRHSAKILHEGDFRHSLAKACLGQMFIADAPLVIVVTAEYGRITDRYGERGVRYAHMECGHVGQNICLQAGVLGLGTVVIGAFTDQSVSETLNLPEKHRPLYVMPIGYTR